MARDYRDVTRAFEAGSLDAAGFSHEDHIGVAWQLLSEHDFIEATHRYVVALRALATRAGVPEKFSMTVTLAFMSLLAERRAQCPADRFNAFLTANPDLTDAGLLERWYSKDRLQCDLGRAAFLMPDKAADCAGETIPD